MAGAKVDGDLNVTAKWTTEVWKPGYRFSSLPEERAPDPKRSSFPADPRPYGHWETEVVTQAYLDANSVKKGDWDQKIIVNGQAVWFTKAAADELKRLVEQNMNIDSVVEVREDRKWLLWPVIKDTRSYP